MTQSGMQPMRTRESAVVFLAITVLGAACFYGLRPWLERAAWASYPAYLASLSLVFVVTSMTFVPDETSSLKNQCVCCPWGPLSR